MNIVKKVTVKGIIGKTISMREAFGDKIPKDGTQVKLAIVAGMANDAVPKETDNGPYYLLKGNFRGVNARTGESIQGGQAILPGIAESYVTGALADETVNSVQFAFEIGVTANESAIRGYEYYVKPLIEQDEADPMNALMNQISGHLPAPDKKKAAE